MIKKTMLALMMFAVGLTASAQEKTSKWYDNIKFSGYGITQ